MRALIFTLIFCVATAGAFASQNKKTVKLRLQSPAGNLCDVTVYFDNGITPIYNSHQDAEMVFNNVAGVPEIWALTQDSVPCSVLGAGDLSTSELVQFGYIAGVNGMYNLSAILLDNFDPTSIVQLEDRKLKVMVDLRQNFYQVQLDTNDAPTGRFYLHVSYPSAFTSTPSNCANNAGRIDITTDPTIKWNSIQLFNDSNTLVATDTSVQGAAVDFNNLSSGTYHVQFNFNQYTYINSFTLAGDYVITNITTPAGNIYTNEAVVFSANSTNANSYFWDFGDGTLIDGVENATQVYLEPGIYPVSLKCGNSFGCWATAQTTVTVLLAAGINELSSKDIKVFAQQKTITVNMNGTLANNAELKVYNLLGQLVYNKEIKAQQEVIDMGKQSSGYYLVSVINNGKENTKRVFITQ
jgi:hypothetical protein